MHPVAHVAHRFALDLQMAEMSHGFAGGEAEHAVVDPAAEQDGEAIDSPPGFGEVDVEGIEPVAVAMGEGVEPGVQAGEGLAVGRQDEEVGRHG